MSSPNQKRANLTRPKWLGSQEPLRELELLIRSRYSLISLLTLEGDRAEALLRLVADRLQIPFFSWTRSKGLRRDGSDQAIYATEDPLQAVAHIESARFPALYHLTGLAPELQDPKFVDHLREALRAYEDSLGALILSGPDIELPSVLRLRRC